MVDERMTVTQLRRVVKARDRKKRRPRKARTVTVSSPKLDVEGMKRAQQIQFPAAPMERPPMKGRPLIGGFIIGDEPKKEIDPRRIKVNAEPLTLDRQPLPV